MKTKGQIVVMGDTHGDWSKFNQWVNKRSPSMILQCGDFGYWPKLKLEIEKGRKVNRNYPPARPIPKPGDTELHFCDGNHEDFTSLGEAESTELYPNVFWQKRGTFLTLPDGRNVLFLGGATSTDKSYRVPLENVNGCGWFPQETLSEETVRAIPDNARIDIVVSHTCPHEFDMDGRANGWDNTRMALSWVLQRYRPPLWYFGHWHHYKSEYSSRFGCRWTCLASFAPDMSSGRSWEVLK